ncbi:MAG: metallo-mystery pair system four-Cys motif protein [Sandaracinus sp.]|nr:metallo-mystery pair system four-Cys motif protein [Sandaracinus sp.]|tara:strand:- start:1612 stop:2421 length:810 start_codon:yes stop_codon:yes gene_type:complete
MRILLACAVLLGLASCGDDGDDPLHTIQFAALSGSEPVACGGTYTGLGAGNADLTVQDFRFYVHDVRLVDATGAETPLVLESDGKWQNDSVALLDFEDGCGDTGNADLRTFIEGRAPAGDYTGIRFKLGVPEALNHQDPVAAEPPLSLSEMFWSWNGGYKFVRIEGTSSVFEGWRLHLGSTLCEGDMMGDATCANGNRPEVALDLDPLNDTVVADLEGLFQGSMLDNTAETAPGCMSGVDDPDCAVIFDNLGLEFGGTASTGQTFFRAP